MTCANCPAPGVWEFRTDGVDPIVFCNECLPVSYRALIGSGVVSKVEAPVAPAAPKKKEKAPVVVEEPVEVVAEDPEVPVEE